MQGCCSLVNDGCSGRHLKGVTIACVCVQIMIKLHNDEQQAAVLAAQGVPGEAVWHLPMPGNLLPAAGMPQGTVLTSEQVCAGS